MHTTPQREGDGWVTPIRFEHLTLNFVIEAAHAVRVEGNEVACSAGLKGAMTVYYRELAADTKGLNDAVEHQAERLLAAALRSHMGQQDLIDDVFG